MKFPRLQYHCLKMSQYFPKPFRSFGSNINVKVDLSNYATNTDLKDIRQIDNPSFVLKANLASLKTDKTELEKKIPDLTDLIQKTKHTELENKIPDVSSLAIKTALTAVEKKIPSFSSLVKKTDHGKKISELKKKLADHNHDKYITTQEFNTLAVLMQYFICFNARLAQPNLLKNTDFDAKLSSLNTKKLLQINQNTYLVKMKLIN